MLPRKEDFDELIQLSAFDCLGPAIQFVGPDSSESKIRNILAGAVKARRDQCNRMERTKAYAWLTAQTGFKTAARKIFGPSTRPDDWLDRKVAYIFRCVGKPLPIPSDKQMAAHMRGRSLQRALKSVCESLQLFERWIGAVSQCVRDYHWPRGAIPLRDDMRKAIKKSATSLERAIKALDELAKFDEWHNFEPRRFMKDWMAAFAQQLRDHPDDAISPISRADGTLSERVFVLGLARKHAKLFGHTYHRERSRPFFYESAICSLLYLEGFNRPIDERNVRELCSKERKRRQKEYSVKESYPTGLVKEMMVNR